jgi:hypothetical protein
VSVVEIWVSDLALVVRPRAGRLEGFVLDARSGEPAAGATVDAWYLSNNGARVAVGPATTDEAGFFAFTQRATAAISPGRHRSQQIASPMTSGSRPARTRRAFDRSALLRRPRAIVPASWSIPRPDLPRRPHNDVYRPRGGAQVHRLSRRTMPRSPGGRIVPMTWRSRAASPPTRPAPRPDVDQRRGDDGPDRIASRIQTPGFSPRPKPAAASMKPSDRRPFPGLHRRRHRSRGRHVA